MGRRSLTEQFFEHYRKEEPGELTCLILYDFSDPVSGKFYNNLNRAIKMSDGIMLQYSAFMTKDQRIAKTVRDLVLHYGGEASFFVGKLVE